MKHIIIEINLILNINMQPLESFVIVLKYNFHYETSKKLYFFEQRTNIIYYVPTNK